MCIRDRLYEAAAEFLNFLILIWIGKRQRFTGQIIATYFLLYGLERGTIEFFRGDPGRTMMFHDTVSLMQIVSLCPVSYTHLDVYKRQVHMSLFPAAEDFENALDASRSAAWDRLLAVRGEVLKALEPVRAAKTISGGLEARVTLAATGELLDLLRKYSAYLPALFIVSQVEIAASPIQGTAPAATLEGLQIRIERALGKKCERCWNYSTHVGESAEYPTLCERCLAALDEIDRDSGVTSGSAKV